jgi:hypothetical protein
MKRGVILMIMYAISMVFYGAVEIGHDLLHYMADHYHSHLHDHHHDHDHRVSDHDHHHDHHHQHDHVSHDVGSEHQQEESIPSGLSFFLFVHTSTGFQFSNSNLLGTYSEATAPFLSWILFPPTPPPKA